MIILGAGIVMVWQQNSQQLVVAGDTSKIRFWDAEKELKVNDLHSGTESCVTCISSDPSCMNFIFSDCLFFIFVWFFRN